MGRDHFGCPMGAIGGIGCADRVWAAALGISTVTGKEGIMMIYSETDGTRKEVIALWNARAGVTK